MKFGRGGKGETGTGPEFSWPERIVLLAAFALLVTMRLPHAWIHGRFQDEEATVFLASAWHFPWQEALFRSFAGYWNLGANASTVALVELIRAGIIPLERAPYFTMLLGLAFQMLPALLLLTGRAAWLQNRLAVVVSLLVVAVAPATEEVYFNVMHIQFYLALCAAIILALELPTGRVARIGYPLLLFLGPLCGPGAIVILPLFVLRALIDRQGGRWIQVAAFMAGAAVQLLLFYGSNAMRGHLATPDTIAAALFVRLIVLRLGGVHPADVAATLITDGQLSGGMIWWWLAAAAAVILLIQLVALSLTRRDSAPWLFVSGILIALASFGYGMVRLTDGDLFGVLMGERYNYLPSALIGLGLIVMATRPGRGRPVFLGLCGLMLISSAYYYTKTLRGYSDGPSWPGEVAAWRADHNHLLAVWPRPMAADLSDRATRCPRPSGKIEPSDDPRYCESGWVGFFYRGMKEQGLIK